MIWAVRINLSSLAQEIACLETDKERSNWLLGFNSGTSGAPMRDDWPTAKMAGWAFGTRSREEAEAFREQKSEAGRNSAAARKMRVGTAQPSKNDP